MRSYAPVDGADAGQTFVATHSLQQQPVSDLPGEHGGVDVFQMQDRLHNSRCGNFGLGSSNHSWANASCLVVPGFRILLSVRTVSVLPNVLPYSVGIRWKKAQSTTIELKKILINHMVLSSLELIHT